jgi:hypothetical protein
MQLYLATVGEVDQYYSPMWRNELDTLPAVATDMDYYAQLDRVRNHALHAWSGTGGGNCTEGTDRFLTSFNIEPTTCEDRQGTVCDYAYDCSWCESPAQVKYVTVTITVRLEVDNDSDEDDTYNDVQRYLSVNTDRIDNAGSADVSMENLHVSTCCHEC